MAVVNACYNWFVASYVYSFATLPTLPTVSNLGKLTVRFQNDTTESGLSSVS